MGALKARQMTASLLTCFLCLSVLCTAAIATPTASTSEPAPTAGQQSSASGETVNKFVEKMVREHGFEASFIRQTLAQASKNNKILEAIARPWEAKPWYQYYPIFLTEKRIAKGVEFYQQHKALLDKVAQETGVPAAIIVAIIGVETFYGTYRGNYSVLDALYTLAFHYPPRSKFFTSELEEFFLLSREEHIAPTKPKGSYAGAMGWGQFISSSYRHYAIDQDQDGKRDLFNNPADAIGSVANYFVRHGWQAEQPVAFPISTLPDEPQEFVSKSLKYRHTWQDLKQHGASIKQPEPSPDTAVKLLEFELEQGKEYWLGLPNFYVITRYNHSPLYAMAVYQLSEEIKQQI